MGIKKEIWVPIIVGNLYNDNKFMERITDDSKYAAQNLHSGYWTITFSTAGTKAGIKKNSAWDASPATLPLSLSGRADGTITYNINSYETGAVMIPNTEQFYLSYDKKGSVVLEQAKELGDAMANDALLEYAKKATVVLSTGSNIPASNVLSYASGNRKAVTAADFGTAMARLSEGNVPENDRFAIVPSGVYFRNLMQIEEFAKFSWTGVAGKTDDGIINNIYGADIYTRSIVSVFDMSGSPTSQTPIEISTITNLPVSQTAATDCPAILLMQTSCVSKSVTGIGVVENPLATVLGPTVSSYGFAGFGARRKNNEGIVALVLNVG